MRTRAWWVVFALASLSAPAASQTVLSEPDALARLSVESPRVRAIVAGIDLARADVMAAARWPNPRVTIDRESVAGVTEHITTVGLVLPITGRRGLEVDAADALVEASTSRAGDQVRRARADLRIAFADLAAAQASEEELVRARDRLRELAEVLGKREAAGESAGFDRIRAEREVLDLEGDLSAALADRARAQGALVGFFAESGDVLTVRVAPSAGVRAMIPAVDALIARAEAVRGELTALGHEIQSARFAERAADRRRIPEPELVGGTKASSVGSGDIGSVIAVYATIPLFDRSQPERAMARARASQARARADAFRLTLRAQIASLRAAVLQRREAADQYRARAIGNADQLERIAQVSYDAGERGILELLDAYRSGSTARIRQVALDAAARQVEIELEFVSGWEIP